MTRRKQDALFTVGEERHRSLVTRSAFLILIVFQEVFKNYTVNCIFYYFITEKEERIKANI